MGAVATVLGNHEKIIVRERSVQAAARELKALELESLEPAAVAEVPGNLVDDSPDQYTSFSDGSTPSRQTIPATDSQIADFQLEMVAETDDAQTPEEVVVETMHDDDLQQFLSESWSPELCMDDPYMLEDIDPWINPVMADTQVNQFC